MTEPSTTPTTNLLNKVPPVTLAFWIIKISCTTVGETGADYLNFNMHLGLTITSAIMAAVLAVALVFQFRAKTYVPWIYWLAVVLVSVVGTLITDNLSDNIGVPLWITTMVFGIALPAVFAWWYRTEKTLSIHHVDTPKREAFYWVAILLTFSLGTAAGDLVAESLHLGYLLSAFIFAGLIAAIAFGWRMGLNATTAFWLAYILTRPLGASIGDYLSSDPDEGGLGLGVTVSSAICLAAIIGTVVFLTVTKKPASASVPAPPA
jgi:uncharacterized membrane-anchored protein